MITAPLLPELGLQNILQRRLADLLELAAGALTKNCAILKLR